MSLWNDPGTERLLREALSRLSAGHREALGDIAAILKDKGGEPFARAVVTRLAAGVPPAAFGFLPGEGVPALEQPSLRLPPAPVTTTLPTPPPIAEVPLPQGTTAPPPAAKPKASAPSPAEPPSKSASAPPLREDGYVTVREVALHFGVSPKAVYRWMAAGRIRSERRPGGSYRIPADQFKSPRN